MLSSLYAVLFSTTLLLSPLAHADTSNENDVDVALVLAVDVSQSIQPEEYSLEKNGIASAFANDEIVQAIQNGSLGRIAVAVVHFASPNETEVVVPFRVLKDKESAFAFAQEILTVKRSGDGNTSISAGITLAAETIVYSPYRATRRVIDVSGDGANNEDQITYDGGTNMKTAQELCARSHIIVNGLPIMGEEANIVDYYQDFVIMGKGSFVVEAKDTRDFARAIRHKLVLEIG